MIISTWNIERPTKTSSRIPLIIKCIKTINPDILILTETNEFIDLGEEYNVFHSSKFSEPFYKDGERRVSIYSKYPSTGHLETFRADTSICINFQTPMGNLSVYGTVIGITGNRAADFIKDLDKQLSDFDKIASNNNLCIAGDFNISFADNYYYTDEGRKKLNDFIKELSLINLTESISRNIDHIVISKTFIGDKIIPLHSWNMGDDKKLSDHMGVSVTIT